MIFYKHIALEQGSDEWLNFRKGKIGGSEIPTIMGVNPYVKFNDYLQEKITGVSSEVSDYTKKIFAEGHEWEEKVRQNLNDGSNWFFKPAVLQSSLNENFFVSLDGIDEDLKLVLEIKSTTSKDILAKIKSGICPDSYYVQIQWQLFITNYSNAMLAVVDRNTGEVFTMTIDRDENKIQEIEIKALRILAMIHNPVVPYIQLETVEVQQLGEKKQIILELKRRIKAIEEEMELAGEQLLKNFNAQKIEGCGVRIQWIQKKGNISWKKIPEVKLLTEEYLDQFRGKSSKYVKISGINEKENDE